PTRGEGEKCLAETFFLPSPLVGEGARRADEGGDAGRFARKSAPAPMLPADPIRGPLSAGAGAAGAHRLAHGSGPWAASVGWKLRAAWWRRYAPLSAPAQRSCNSRSAARRS